MHYFTKDERKKIEELARKNRVTIHTIRERLKACNFDWGKVDHKSHEVPYKYFLDGVPAVLIAKQNGISKERFGQRVRAGWSIKRACTYKEPSLKEIALKTGLSTSQVHNYIYNKGISKEEILNGTFNNTRKSQS